MLKLPNNICASTTELVNSHEPDRFGTSQKWRLLMSKSKQKSRFLVVDDDETVGIGISELLKDVGFEADYVLNGRSAIDAVIKTGSNIIFLDMVMPGLNGLETFREIIKVAPDAKVILLTGYFLEIETAVAQGIKEGMIDESIRKPCFASEIIKVARKYA